MRRSLALLVACGALIVPTVANAYYRYLSDINAHMWWTDRPNTIFVNKSGAPKLVQNVYNSSDVWEVPHGGVRPFTAAGGSGVVMYSPSAAGVEVWFCTAQLDCRKASNP